MVKGEQSRSQRMIGLPFTLYSLPYALRSALSALRLNVCLSKHLMK